MKRTRSRPTGLGGIVGVLIAALTGCGQDSKHALDASADFPCRVELVPTGLVLAADSSDRRPDPGARVARDSRGWMYTDAVGGGRILRWTPSGQFDTAVGRMGDGPGELSGGALHLYVAGDTLYVRENNRRWSLFSLDLKFIAHRPMGGLGGVLGFTHFLDDGRVLDGWPATLGRGPRNNFLLATREGEALRSFSKVDPDQTRSGEIGRRLTAPRDGRFWAAAGARPSVGYELEQWSVTGERVRVVTRRVPWFLESRSEGRSTQLPPLPYFGFVHEPTAGILVTMVATAEAPLDPTVTGPELLNSLGFHLEVLDLGRSEVLASTRIAAGELPVHLFEDSWEGYRTREDSVTGRVDLEFFELRLTAVSNGSCRLPTR